MRLSTLEREEILEKFRTLPNLAYSKTEVVYPISRNTLIADLLVFFDTIIYTTKYTDNS